MLDQQQLQMHNRSPTDYAKLRDIYYGHALATDLPRTRTLNPYVTGTSVIGVRFRDGVMIASDTLASYGSLARFRTQRIIPLNRLATIAAGGDISDFQSIVQTLRRILTADFCLTSGVHESSAHELFSYLSRLMYQQRNRFDPLWNEIIIGGFDKQGNVVLGYIDLNGTAYRDSTIATGYGAYLAIPLLRERQSNDMSREDAQKLLEDCLRVCFYRDARASNMIQVATITQAETVVSDPYLLDTDWSITEINA